MLPRSTLCIKYEAAKVKFQARVMRKNAKAADHSGRAEKACFKCATKYNIQHKV